MLKGKVINWIINLQNDGIEDNTIIKKLRDAGYPKKVISELFRSASKKKNIIIIANKAFVILAVLIVLILLLKTLSKYPYYTYLPQEGIFVPFQIFIGVHEPELYKIYGEMLMNTSRYSEAIKYFEKNLEDKWATYPYYLFNYLIAKCYHSLNDDLHAREHLSKVWVPYYDSLTVRYFDEEQKILYIGVTEPVNKFWTSYYINRAEKIKGNNSVSSLTISNTRSVLSKNIPCIWLSYDFKNATDLAAYGNFEKAGMVADYIARGCEFYSKAIVLQSSLI